MKRIKALLKSKKNKGFSLIELLVAVAILGIVVAPLLHSFVTSANIAAKSRRLGDATLAGQNVAELVNASDVTGNLAKLNTTTNNKLGSYTVTGVTAQDYGADGTTLSDHTGTGAADRYVLTLSDGKLDTVVTLDAQAYAAYNSQEATKYNAMGAVFDQSAGTDPDSASFNGFTLKAKALNAVSYSLVCKRYITLNIQEGLTGATKTCKYTMIFDYTCAASYTDETGKAGTASWTDSYTYSFYDGTYDGDELPSIYMFFNSYSTKFTGAAVAGTTQEVDTVEIDHKKISDTIPGETPVKVFIACQGEMYPITAKAVIRLYDAYYFNNHATSSKTATTIFCNIPKGKYTFKEFYKNNWYISTTYLESLLETSTSNRMYAMTVEVYGTGEDKTAANRLFLIDTTKLSD